ncbi:MAG: M23 family metallopeptidase, partial [Candidatus Binatia bacterium]
GLLKIIDLRKALLYVLLLVIILGGGIFIVSQFERHAPTISIKPAPDYISTRPFKVEINERGKGLREASITILAAGQEYPIFAEEYESPVMEKQITVTLSPTVKIPDGPAVLRVTATDRSYWGFFSGNKASISKDVAVDFTAPTIELKSGVRNVNFGGSGLIIYESSSDTIKSGVRIGRYLFPGYKGHIKDSNAYLAFFAHPYDVPTEEKATIIAVDKAGNSGVIGLSYTLRNIRYKKRTVNVTDSYIERKVASLLGEGSSQQASLKDVFIKVNHSLRKENEAKIRKICEESINAILWSRAFHQLSNSKVEANFADERTYTYKGEIIEHAYHLGYDLAVTRNYPIEAANDGVVVFTGDLGIYGNTVIIDHGFGLFTMYSHMSLITVNKGDKVQQKQLIGKTGETGLATGDHLHYATLIHGVPVLPLEWWDGKWIKDNILGKIQN